MRVRITERDVETEAKEAKVAVMWPQPRNVWSPWKLERERNGSPLEYPEHSHVDPI